MQVTMMRDGTLLVIPDSAVEEFALTAWKWQNPLPEGIIVKTSSSTETSEELNEAMANLLTKY